MKRGIFLTAAFWVLGVQAQHMRWDWAKVHAICPDSFTSGGSGVGTLNKKEGAPIMLETDLSGNVYTLGYVPRISTRPQNPLTIDAGNTKTELDFHYSANINVYYYTKYSAAGVLQFAILIASEGIPFVHESAQAVGFNRNTGELYLGFKGRSTTYPVYIGEVSPLIPAKANSSFAVVINSNGNYVNRIEIADPTTATTIKDFLFPDNNQVYVIAEAGLTAPDFNKAGRLFVFDVPKDSIVASYKHFASISYKTIKKGSNNLLTDRLDEYKPDGTMVKAFGGPAFFNNIRDVTQILQKSNGNYVLQVTSIFNFQAYFLETTPAGSIKWAVAQAGVANQWVQLDAQEHPWILLSSTTDSVKAFPRGYTTPVICRVDTSKNHSFDYVLAPTNYNGGQVTAFTTYGSDFYMAGGFDYEIEFADQMLKYTCQFNQAPWQQFLAKAVPGWQQTRKNLSTDMPQFTDAGFYPNPALDRIQFRTAGFVQCRVTDLQGRIYADLPVADNVADVSSLRTGVYFLEIRHVSGKTVRTKLIKQP